MEIFQMLFNSLMRFLRTQVWAHSFSSLYTTPLSTVISKFNVTHHLYADDTHIYLELNSRNFNSTITELANYLETIQVWMGNKKLQLNPDKTEFILIGDDQIRNSMKLSFPVSLIGNGTSGIRQNPWCYPGC